MLDKGIKDIMSEFLDQEDKVVNISSLERKGRVGKDNEVEVNLRQEGGVWNSIPTPSRNSVSPMLCHRGSLLPLLWRITHNSHWKAQVLTSELSLIAFILLLVMVFSKKWLYLSKIRFHQRWPMNVSNRIYMLAHVMSMGLLQICRSKSCSNSENGKDSLKLWINHPIFEVAKITFCMALGLGFIFTIWLHLPYIPGLQRLSFFGWIGTIMSFCEVTFIFFTLMLFPINIWIFELKRNLSIPIGWSYFIGWVVFVLYVTCAFLCYFNNKHFRSLILSHPSDTTSCSSRCRSDSLNEGIVSNPFINQEEVLDPEQEKAPL